MTASNGADATGGTNASAAKPPARVRVTAPRAGGAGEASARPAGAATRATQATGATAHGTPGPAEPASPAEATDVHDVYVRSLIRSQLRLALVCAAGFVAATVLFVLAIVWAPALDETFLAGVPVSWLLLAGGVYPLALTIAALYVRAAARNEARYRSLAEES